MQPFQLSKPMGLARTLSFSKFSFRKAKVIWRMKWFIFFYWGNFLILLSSSFNNWFILNSTVNISTDIFIITRYYYYYYHFIITSQSFYIYSCHQLSRCSSFSKNILSCQLICFVSMFQLHNAVTSFAYVWNKEHSTICRKWV